MFEFCEHMCSQTVMPLELYIKFKQVGSVHAQLSHTTDTVLINVLVKKRLFKLATDATLLHLQISQAAQAQASNAQAPAPAAPTTAKQTPPEGLFADCGPTANSAAPDATLDTLEDLDACFWCD